MEQNAENSVSKTLIELRSEEVQELLTRPPKALIRWGTTIIFSVLLVIFLGAWVVHYPDLVHASFKLNSSNAPKMVLTRTEGKIVRLLTKEGQTVKSGANLAYLESTTKHEEVLRLSSQLTKAWLIASKGDLESLSRLNLSRYNQLGELQNDYQTFTQNYIKLRAYLENGYYSQKKKILQQEIVDLHSLEDNLHQQQQIQDRDRSLAEEEFAIQRQLADEKVLASLEIKREESKLMGRRLPYQQTGSAIISNLTAQRNKQKEILELDQQVAEERDNFLQSLTSLQSAVENWKQKYVLKAPVTGKVQIIGTVQENQSVIAGQELFYVVPLTMNYYGELRIPQQNAGKVAIGQTVLIKFLGYPYQEYGAVHGHISSIASIPLKDSIFLARVQLPDGLKTNYNKTLVYKIGMIANADIVTDDTRLLEKFFYQLRKLANGR